MLTSEPRLHREWENYTRQISGGATSTAASVLFSPFTAGVSLVGLGLSGPRIHNARKKREIIEAGLKERGTTHHTRKRDVVAPMAIAGTLSGLTLGLAAPGADMIVGAAGGHVAGMAVSHAAVETAAHIGLETTGAVAEHTHDKHEKKKADVKLRTQYENFKIQYEEELKVQMLSSPSTGEKPVQVSQTTAKTVQSESQAPAQDQKYEYVSVTEIYENLTPNQPTSHQPQLAQPASQPQMNVYQPESQNYAMQQSEKYLVTVPAPALVATVKQFSEKSTVYATTTLDGKNSDVQSLASGCPTPAPAYSQPQRDGSNPESVPDDKGDLSPPALTMEEEILYLRMRLLQLEMEKRGSVVQTAEIEPQPQQLTQNVPVQSQAPQILVHGEHGVIGGHMQTQPHPVLTSLPQLPIQSQQQQTYLPPPSPGLPPRPASPALPPRPCTPQAPLSPNPQMQTYQPQYFPPPPASPKPQVSFAQPQQAYYPPPPKSPRPQQHLDPKYPRYRREDSGYYSAAQTPMSAASPPPPYFPPPPGSNVTLAGKDYFNRDAVSNMQSYQPGSYTAGPSQRYQGSQGWQWGTAAPVAASGNGNGGEPNYGPPPPVPAPWKG